VFRGAVVRTRRRRRGQTRAGLGGAPDGAVVPVARAGDHEALQGIMMLRGEAPELRERGAGHQGQEYTPAPGRVGLERVK
jgi:hypothetical protein